MKPQASPGTVLVLEIWVGDYHLKWKLCQGALSITLM